jgi:hypothetical protein
LIDNLPGNSVYAQTIMNDPAYADRVAAAYEPAKDEDRSRFPALTEFGSIEMLLAEVVDGVEALRISFIQANIDPDKGQPPKFKPRPRPRTVVGDRLEQVKQDARWSRHKALVRRLKAVDSDPSEPEG